MSQPTIYLRHATRHLQRTLSDHVSAQLDALGWTATAGPVPFGTTPVQVLARRMREYDMQAINGNLVAISFGDESDDESQELGGGLMSSQTHLLIDVVGVNDPVGLALASDLKDLLTGRAPGTSRFLTLADYSDDPAGTPVPSYRIEILNVLRSRPSGDIKAFWQIIAAEIEMTFPGQD